MNKTVIVIVGADGGLGKALAENCQHLYMTSIIEVNGPGAGGYDFRDVESVYEAAEMIRERTVHMINEGVLAFDYYPVLINCVGVNYIEWFSNVDFNEFDRLMMLNVKSHLILLQELLGNVPFKDDVDYNWFRDTGCLVEIISNASHMPMTNSVVYNATKGAQHIATLALARELRKTHGLTIFGVSPNKLKGTGMSDYIESRVPGLRGWTPEQAHEYQLSALPAGEETPPEAVANFITYLVSKPEHHKYLTNTVIPYGA